MSHNEELYEVLVSTIFSGVMASEKSILDEIKNFSVEDGILALERGELLFTLPALFRFLLFTVKIKENETFFAKDYKAFRQKLYQMPTNTHLRQLGWAVSIEKSHSTHDHRVYRLGRC